MTEAMTSPVDSDHEHGFGSDSKDTATEGIPAIPQTVSAIYRVIEQ